MNPARRILIVDPSPESREVLCALLERSGLRPLEADTPAQAERLNAFAAADLIVCDLDSDPSAGQEGCRKLAAQAVRRDTPIVLLGAVRRQNDWTSGGEFIAKPYHYEPLIRRIEALLANRQAA